METQHQGGIYFIKGFLNYQRKKKKNALTWNKFFFTQIKGVTLFA